MITIFMVLFSIWFAGGLATLGFLHGLVMFNDKKLSDRELGLFEKFVQSWYAFGVLVGLSLEGISSMIENKK